MLGPPAHPGRPAYATEAPPRVPADAVGHPSASVVVCAYSTERSPRLLAALESVRTQTLIAAEIIVVVDHNPDLLGWVRAQRPDVRVVENDGPRGLSGARNTGVRAAVGEIVAFLDDDAVAARDWLARLSEGYRDPRVLAVGGATLPDWEMGAPAWFPEEFRWVVGCSYRGMPETREPVRNLIGCNMSFRRSVLREVGPFLEDLGRVGSRPVGCEETELCIRVSSRFPRGTILYDPEASVVHHVPSARGRFAYFRRRCFAEGLSKAAVRRAVGSGPALASERRYALRTLPSGFAIALRSARGRRPWPGIARAAAIVTGLALTTAGYVVGTATGRA